MKKQIFPKTFAIFLAISFLFLNISGVFVNQAQALDPTGTIIVNKFNDENGDGVWDDDEILLISYPVFISLEDSEERINPDTTTNESVFNNVPVGNYYICEEIQEGWENTKPGTEAFDWGDGTMVVCYGPEALAEGETIEVDFGNHLIEEEEEEEASETTTTTTIAEEEEEVSETTTTTTIAEEEEEVPETTTTTILAAQVTTTIAEGISEEDELEEDLEETEESEEKASYNWNWVLIVLLIIVGGVLLFSKK
jgi:hypothetical protein